MMPILNAALPVLGSVLDKVIPDPKARDKAKLEVQRLQQEGELKETELQLSAIIAEANSKDPWTSRARPTFLYVMYLLIVSCLVGAIVGVWYPDQVSHAGDNLAHLLNAIPEPFVILFGSAYLGYTGARSFEKAKGKAQ